VGRALLRKGAHAGKNSLYEDTLGEIETSVRAVRAEAPSERGESHRFKFRDLSQAPLERIIDKESETRLVNYNFCEGKLRGMYRIVMTRVSLRTG
jgi:hypothetical protein